MFNQNLQSPQQGQQQNPPSQKNSEIQSTPTQISSNKQVQTFNQNPSNLQQQGLQIPSNLKTMESLTPENPRQSQTVPDQEKSNKSINQFQVSPQQIPSSQSNFSNQSKSVQQPNSQMIKQNQFSNQPPPTSQFQQIQQGNQNLGQFNQNQDQNKGEQQTYSQNQQQQNNQYDQAPQQISLNQNTSNQHFNQPMTQTNPSQQIHNKFHPPPNQYSQQGNQIPSQLNQNNDLNRQTIQFNQQIPSIPQIQQNNQLQQVQNINSMTNNQQFIQPIVIPQQQNQAPPLFIQSLQPMFQKKIELTKQIEENNSKINSLTQLQQKSKIEIQNLQKNIEEEEIKQKTLTQQIEVQQQNFDSKIQEMQNQFDQLQVDRNELQIQLGLEVQKFEELNSQLKEQKRISYFDQNKQMLSQIDQLEIQNQKLKEDIQLKTNWQSNTQSKEYEIKRLSEIIEKKNKQLSSIQSEQNSINEEITAFESHLQLRDQNINQMNFELKKEEKTLKTLQQQVESMQEEIKINENRIRLKTDQISQLEEKTLAALRVPNAGLKISALKKSIEDKTLEYDQEINRKKQDLTQSKLIMMKNKKDQKELEEHQRNLKIKQGKELQMKFKESYGQLEVCFLIDSTKSMEPYKRQAQLCVKGSVKAIKDLTQRDSNWSSVCYVDTDILPRLGGIYQQFGFSKDSDELENFIQSVSCTGNRDLPEDVEGGMKQMLNNLPWQTKFKLAILICDCPSHGTKYHDYGRNGDYQPDSDLTPVIEKIIEEEIFFIGIIFTDYTIKMYNEFRKIFERHNKEEYFILSDLRKVPQDKQFLELTKILSNVSQTATQTNVKATRTQNQSKAIKQTNNQDDNSSVEALCKINLSQGLNADNAIRETFKVFRVQMKEESFLAKMKMIQNIDIQDFDLFEENDWDCLRSKSAFAKGQNKAAFLMTKSKYMNSKNELYVCKTPLSMVPYSNQESALKECILHLVSQKWLKKFYKDLNEATARTKTQVQQMNYSDILLLKDGNNKYWLAERFFEGTFVKYNNNWGFVNDSKDNVNIIAQCFSYYTYYKSDFQYLICDIQGVGTCLTDPAICTANNYKIDATDMGEEGIGRFSISFGKIKNECQSFLQGLKINV